MTPFEALPVLADELVASLPDKAAAVEAKARFLAQTIGQMRDFANGHGNMPEVVFGSFRKMVPSA